MNTAVPFTIDADIDLGVSAAPWLRAHGADVVIRQGSVPDALPNPTWRAVACQCAEGRVLFAPPGGVRILVEGGETIRYAVQNGSDLPGAVGPAADSAATEKDIRAFLVGSAWPALVLQRGLIPLHASAVNRGGNVHAVAGRGGIGKSTFAASLAARGWPFFADDVLVVEAAPGDCVRCWSLGDLKLWPDALAVSDATAVGRVRDVKGLDRVYAEPRQRSSRVVGRLRTLHKLRGSRSGDADPIRVKQLAGVRVARELTGAVYSLGLARGIAGRQRPYQWAAAASGHVKASELWYPRLREWLDKGLDRLAQELSAVDAPAPEPADSA